jgi:hypothetical protein
MDLQHWCQLPDPVFLHTYKYIPPVPDFLQCRSTRLASFVDGNIPA